MANIVSFVFKGIDRFSNAAKSVAASAEQVKDKFRGASHAAWAFRHRMELLKESSKETGDRLKNLGTRISVGVTLPVTLLGKSMLQAASDSVETGNKFRVVFQGIEEQANSVATNLAQDFGLASDAAKQLLGDTGDLLTGFGFSRQSALDLSKQVQELSVDLASFTNFTGGAEGASKALTKALLGERESVKSLGVSILEEDVKRKIQDLRLKGVTFESVRQAKAIATLAIAQEQSKNAIGDFARSSKEFANQQRILSQRTSDLSGELGLIFLPTATKIISKLIELVEWIRTWSTESQKIALIIAGVVAIGGPLLIFLGSLIAIFPSIMIGLTAIGAAFLATFSPIGAIVIGIGALITAGVLLKQNWIAISDVIGGTIEQIGINVSIFIDTIVGKINSFKDIVSNFTSSLSVSNLVDKLSDVFNFGGNIETTANNRTQVDVNLNAPRGVVRNVETRTTGKTKNFNMGMNVVTTPGGA